jgi:uncharacterized protein (DUF302 family)
MISQSYDGGVVMFKKTMLFGFLLLFYAGLTWAEHSGVMQWDVNQQFNRVYREVYRSMEEHRFFVIFEANIGANLRGYAGRRGENPDRIGLEEIRSMVFCNIAYTQQLASQDPDVLSLCPMHITFVQKGPTTRILFTRPTVVGQGSTAMPLLKEIETEVDEAVKAGISAATAHEPMPRPVMPPSPVAPPVP